MSFNIKKDNYGYLCTVEGFGFLGFGATIEESIDSFVVFYNGLR